MSATSAFGTYTIPTSDDGKRSKAPQTSCNPTHLARDAR